ncbi:hypothetical protein PENSPDRAFT_577031 [Peniophora sp. CONT]|nr:hypothetical protein PENSPDRAFT_577031 [Peniophora sp. CONT]
MALADTDARADWAYVNEGNAAAVFAYDGPLHARFTRTVIRLRKTTTSAHSQVDEQSLATEVDDAEDPMLAFQRVAIDPLVPPEYRARIETVLLDPDWFASFADAHAHNLRAGQSFDTSRSRATLAENLIGFPWAVEIKPKWGFLPASSPSSVKSRTCRTCMHDHYRRVKDHKDLQTHPLAAEEGVDAYCPLDLFSGDVSRVRRALGALWTRWERGEGKENKLRMFVPWRMLSPADVSKWKTSCLGLPEDADVETCREAFIARLLPALCTTPVIPLLASLQRRLDALGEPLALSASYPENEPTLEEWEAFTQRFQRDEVRAEDAPLAYMLSATFKDCSMIIGLPDGKEPVIKLVDLDVKSVSKFAYWIKLDKDIIASYGQLGESERRVCVDALSSGRRYVVGYMILAFTLASALLSFAFLSM